MSFPINRRLLLTVPLAAAAGRSLAVNAQTPASVQVGDQLARYQAERDALLATGRATIAALLEPNDADFSAAMAYPDLASLSAASELSWLQTNRVRLRWSDLPLLIDDHFDGSGTMAGLAWRTGGPTSFVLTADTDQARPVPTGRWTGSLVSGEAEHSIVVTFDGEEDLLSATLDVPDQQLAGLPATSAQFLPELPVGDLIQDTALPLGESNRIYRADYAWGDALLGLEVVVSPDEGVIGFSVALREVLPPDPALHLEPAVTLRLPASGPLLVAGGGPAEFQNYHAATPAQRHALDLLVWENGATYRNDGMTNGDYLVWGFDILAPADGRVAAVLNDQPDIVPLVAQGAAAASASSGSETASSNPAGNHVVLEVAPGTCIVLAHLQRGSIVVNVGDRVSAGERLGLVGNSGKSSEPHIHMHAQTGPDLLDPAAIGLPLIFTSYLADGQLVDSGSPVQGQFVEQE